MFKVERGGNRKELFRTSQVLSAYIRHTITEKKTSAWIAQRNGRTKDGSDKTETGLLKMFNISGNCNFAESFSELNMVPLAISYEYEPCCAFKIREVASVLKGIPYKKEPKEDFISILNGITQQKGRIHLAACNPVNEYLHEADVADNNNDKINRLAALIDASIFKHYRLWPNNYIAFDQLSGRNEFHDRYSTEDINEFEQYITRELSIFKGNQSFEHELLLKMYARPLINAGLASL
jgi:hypothetical protein